jgi:AhpD family alkylhydroperoxidase
VATFQSYTIDSAPEAAKAKLAEVQKAWGFVPKLQGNLAESQLALEAYNALWDLVPSKATLSPIEQQVAYLTVTVFHACEYCTAGHTYLSRMAKMDEAAIAALRNGTPIPDARLEALRVFTESVVRERGCVGDAAVDAFLAAGFTRAQVLEVITIIATKTISNYTNHITRTAKEDFMADPALGWVAPRNRARSA